MLPQGKLRKHLLMTLVMQETMEMETMETMQMTTTEVMAMKMDMRNRRKTDVEEITDESTHLALAGDDGGVETMETQEPMDVD